MKMKIFYLLSFFVVFNSLSQNHLFCNDNVNVGASKLGDYLPGLESKRVAIIGNQSSLIGSSHLVDSLLLLDVNIVKVFSPEHGFRGKADAGEKVKSGIDSKTGLPIISLYGNNKKPKAEQLEDVDVILFDIQDVGARFYTYISTLHYVMEACAENDIKLIILDRPNPNGHYVDGPILDLKYKSFVGMHQVPIVHGMTVGEYAQMINGEKWLPNNLKCDLTVVKASGWDHTKYYKLPIKPSPNLPNMLAIYLYPSLCLFEGTVVSVGRGSVAPFQIIGHPGFEKGSFAFTPISFDGAKYPKLENEKCYGIDFTAMGLNVIQKQNQIHLTWLIHFYKKLKLGQQFFLKNNFINLLAGSNAFKDQIIAGLSEEEIRATWYTGLIEFKIIRKKYLLYLDFE
jgi:uncharacterized protein YbbC (DUF1343 family)